MKKYLLDILNGILIVLGACALADVFDDNFNKVLLGVAAGFGAAYLVISILLFIVCPVKFDWHLVRGNYILKVLAFVLYTPFVMTGAYSFWGEEKSPMALTYEENLYKEVKQDGICPAATTNLPDEIRNKQEDPSLFWSVYYHYIDPGNQHMTTTPDGRLWAAIIGILGVFLVNGLLVSAIIGWIDIRKEKWLKGEVKYPILLWFWEHYVIIGGNDMVAGIVRQLFESKEYRKSFFKPYILIQTNRDVEDFRRELFSGFTEKQQRRIIVYYGGRTSEDDIAELQLRKAKEVYILGEDTRTDDIESYHDTMNMHCLKLIYEYLSEREPYKTRIKELNDLETQIDSLESALKQTQDEKLRVEMKNKRKTLKNTFKAKEKEAESNAVIYRVMFEYQTTFSIFQFSEISNDIKTCIRFKPFNYYEMWAQQVLINKAIEKQDILNSAYLPLEGVDGIGKNDDRYVHLIIVGMSRMGVSMAIEAAHLAHYPNFAQKNIRTKITFIDKNAKEEKDFFMGRFKNLFALSHWRYGSVDEEGILKWKPQNDIQIKNTYHYLGGDFLDVEWEFLNGGVENVCIQEYITASVNNQSSIVTIAVCLPEPSRCLAAALYLNRDVYEKVNQVLVYNRYGDSLVVQMTHKTDKQMNPYSNKLRAFGMSAECYHSEMIQEAEIIAQKLNDEYGNLYVAVDEGEGPDKSDVAKWWSNIYAANFLWSKLRNMQWSDGKELTEEELDTMARTEHARWNMEQLLIGYRPLTATEQAEVLEDIKLKNPYKGKLAHYDICSFARLEEIDKGSIRYDIGLSRILPIIYKELNVGK